MQQLLLKKATFTVRYYIVTNNSMVISYAQNMQMFLIIQNVSKHQIKMPLWHFNPKSENIF